MAEPRLMDYPEVFKAVNNLCLEQGYLLRGIQVEQLHLMGSSFMSWEMDRDKAHIPATVTTHDARGNALVTIVSE